jgi:AAA+ ATPase superfamily predicted ATPase
MKENPFTIYTYRGPEYFCDRNAELSLLLELIDNRRYGLLYSMRRLGKTGLIHHFHHTLKKRKGVITVYCDVQNTRSDAAFATKLITAVVGAIEKTPKGATQRIGAFFSSLRPVLSFDPVTQTPSLQLQIESAKDVQMSLNVLFQMLGETKKTVQIALDEFQQIANYDDTVIDSTLRGYLDKVPNVHFLFCGSQRHVLLELFSDAKKPFYGAVEQMQLQFLDRQFYREFITSHFLKAGQKITEDAVSDILDWTRGHKFYTQYFCNKLFSKQMASIGLIETEGLKREILFSFEPSYLSLESVLSKNQLKLLRAIAHEDEVTSVSTSAFLSQYQLAQSTAQQALGVLLDKELLYEDMSPDGSRIFVYDPYFSRWLQSR